MAGLPGVGVAGNIHWPRRRTALLFRRPDLARSGVAGCLEGAADQSERSVRSGRELVPWSRRQSGSARRQRQHRGRGAGLELVHQSGRTASRSEEHTSELQSRLHLVCRLLLEKKKKNKKRKKNTKQQNKKKKTTNKNSK